MAGAGDSARHGPQGEEDVSTGLPEKHGGGLGLFGPENDVPS